MAADGEQRDGGRHGEGPGGRVLDVSGLPGPVADAVALLVEQAARPASADGGAGNGSGADAGAGAGAGAVSRERLGDVVRAAEVVKGFADAVL
ncbi:hypothetical protein EFY87_16545, partial [Flexivirga caeni]